MSLLLDLAQLCADCYAPGVKYAWEGECKTSHVLHSVGSDGVHSFAFCGTLDLEEWAIDIMAIPVPVPHLPNLGDLHAGFLIGALAAVSDFIYPTLKAANFPKFYLTGHSKGAAQAGQAHAILTDLGCPPLATRMFEPPFFGGARLAEVLRNGDVEWTQTYNIHRADAVTCVPIGPSWHRHKAPIRVQVPDTYNFVTMHGMVTVLSMLEDEAKLVL